MGVAGALSPEASTEPRRDRAWGRERCPASVRHSRHKRTFESPRTESSGQVVQYPCDFIGAQIGRSEQDKLSSVLPA